MSRGTFNGLFPFNSKSPGPAPALCDHDAGALEHGLTKGNAGTRAGSAHLSLGVFFASGTTGAAPCSGTHHWSLPCFTLGPLYKVCA